MTSADSIQAPPPMPGSIVKSSRESLLLSQDQLAQAAGVSVSTVARLERGSVVSGESLKAVCAVLGLDAVSLRNAPKESGAEAGPVGPGPVQAAAAGPLPGPRSGLLRPAASFLGLVLVAALLSVAAGEVGTQAANAAMVGRRQAFDENFVQISVMLDASEVNKAAAMYSAALPADQPDRRWEPWRRTKPIQWFSCRAPASYVSDLVDAFAGTNRDLADRCRERAVTQRMTRRDGERTDFVVGPTGAREQAAILSMLTADPSVSIQALVTPLGDVPPDGSAWFDPRSLGGQGRPRDGQGGYLHLRLARAR